MSLSLFNIEVGVGIVVAALSSLGFLQFPVVGWTLLALGIGFIAHGGLGMGGIAFRWPLYKKASGAYRPVQRTNTDEAPIASSPDQGQRKQTETQELASWMRRIALDDATQVSARVIAWPKKPELHFTESPPYIDFVFDTVNATIFLIDLGKEIDGHIRAAGRTLVARPEIAPISGYSDSVSHGARREVRIRQYLNDDDINTCLAYKEPQSDDAPVPFDFTQLNVWVTTYGLASIPSAKARLSVHSPIYITIPGLVRRQD